AIETCKVFLVVLSPSSTVSDNVIKELSIAESSRKKILPVLFQPVDIPRAMTYQLAGLQYQTFDRGDYAVNFSRLLEAIANLGIQVHAEFIRPIPLPSDLQIAIESSLSSVREGAVRELTRLLNGSIPGLVISAHESLKQLADDDSRSVSRTATLALEEYAARTKQKDAQADQERLARERASQEFFARERAEQERIAREKTEQEKLAKEKYEADRLMREKVEAERIAREKAAQEKLAKEKMAAERISREKAENERLAREKFEKENLAKEKLEAERVARDKNEKDRIERENAEAERVLPPETQLRGWLPLKITPLPVVIGVVAVFLIFIFLLLQNNSATPTQIAQASPTIAQAAVSKPTDTLVLTATQSSVPTRIPTTTSSPISTPRTSASPTPLPTATPAPGTVQRRGNDNAEMVYVPAGDFTMGSNDGRSLEKPVHTVFLDAFWMDKYEVTNALYKKCVDAGKCSAPRESKSYTRSSYYGNAQYNNYPVIYVSWDDAIKYCAFANKQLPTEAQWEKAARGTDKRIFPWGDIFDANKLNSSERGKGDTTVVGSYPNGASPYGVMDMAGNVLEWVADWYDSNYYSSSPRNNPKGPSSGQDRVLRGGSWYVSFNQVGAAYRAAEPLDIWSNVLGFRCVESFLVLPSISLP
ncbi:MAG: SUMF1/EgtB/PvdO family nonheme iron enzyme, partial [Chloroflexi bacterium]|nr:SUMF1/EgtB/PvdO family nonheme iron enzyme [Chloroflexota bacterium]